MEMATILLSTINHGASLFFNAPCHPSQPTSRLMSWQDACLRTQDK
jgi:hypothetical protein